MGPSCGLKVARRWRFARSCKQGMSEDSLSAMSATTSIPRARDEQNHFPTCWMRQTMRPGSRPSVATRMSSTIVTGSYWHSGTSRCLPKQGIISARLSHITIKVKQKQWKGNTIIRLNRTMERKMCLHTYFRGISFPRTNRAWYPWQDRSRKPFRSGRGISWHSPNNSVWLIDK